MADTKYYGTDAEKLLMSIPLEDLKALEADAQRDVRTCKSLKDLVQLTAEWRLIESVYLKRLAAGQ